MTAVAVEARTGPAATPTGKPEGHEWIGAAEVGLTLKDAKRADLRGSYRTAVQTQIHVLEVYCRNCRRPFEDVADRVCEAAMSKDHLIGGIPGVRAKRVGHSAPGHSCVDLGCNTGIGLAAKQQAAQRNGIIPDTRRRPAPALAPAVSRFPSNWVAPAPRPAPVGNVRVAPVITLDPEAEARHAARVLAARRGKRRPVNPLALTLW